MYDKLGWNQAKQWVGLGKLRRNWTNALCIVNAKLLVCQGSGCPSGLGRGTSDHKPNNNDVGPNTATYFKW
jgi:hypothetical protein